MTAVLAALLLVMVLGTFGPGALGQADLYGQWSTSNYAMTINPVHAALLRNGKILVIAGSGNCPPSQAGCPLGAPYNGSNHSGAVVVDPVTTNITQLSLAWDMFCSAMTALGDGRILVAGGNLAYDPFHGYQKASIFDPGTNAFTDVQSMAHGRWYPTLTLLSDGRAMVFSGFNETGATNNAVEIYTVGTGWSTQFIAPWTPPLYTRQHLLPNGNVFVSGPQQTTYTFNPSNQAWTTIATTKYGGVRTYGGSVLLPLTPANSYDPRVMLFGGSTSATTSTTELIDLGAATPAWKFGPNMTQARIEMNSVLLPSGKVLALGGSSSDEVINTASLNADLFNPDPAINSVSSAGMNAYPRLYHSVALLLPDATVWVAGGNPVRGNWESRIESYQPAYLFTRDGNNAVIPAPRPTITGAPTNITWGGQFSVSTPDAANISQAVLVRPGSSTHAFDFDQRLVGLSFTVGSGSLTVTAPPSNKIAPPGYYMLFLINNNGVPSVAPFVLLGGSGSNPAPTVTSLAPNTGTAAGGTPVTVTGTGFLAGATLKLGGTTATGVTVVSSTSITATTPAHSAGAVSVAVTNTDAQTGSLNNGYTYSSSAPAISSITPNTGTAAGGTSVTITGTGFLTGATVSLGGTAATNVTVVSGTSITAKTPAHAAGAVSVVVTNPDAQSATLPNGYTYASSGGGGAISFVQVKSATTTSGSSVAATFAAAQTAGNLNVVAVMWGDTTSAVSAVTDSKGNTYGPAVGPTKANGLSSAIYYAKSIAAGSNTVTVTFNKVAGWPNINVMEYSGLDTVNPLDVVSAASGTGTTANSGSATTTSATELIVGAGNPVTTFTAAGSGFSNRIINSFGGISEDKIVTSTGSYNATATMTSGGWVMQMAAFRASGQGGSNPAPTVSTISPATGAAAGGTVVTITGTGFLGGATVKLGGTAATNVVVGSSTSITATTPAHAAGAADVVVTNTDAQSGTLPGGYTYTPSNPAPMVTTISPATGTAAGGTAVTITGTGFLGGATVKLGGTAATNVVVGSSTSITATTPAHAAGAVDVVVTNTDAQSATLPGGYTYTPSNPAPTVSTISPATGAAAGGTAVTITGTGFLAGATVKLGGTAATGVTLVSSTSITAMTPAHAAGAVDVVVTNTDAQSATLPSGYTYTSSNPAPTVTTISPATGTTTGGTAVTITGTGFLGGATVKLGGTAATNVVVGSSTSITATTPAHAAGAVDVVVTNTDAQSATLPGGYTYTPSNPAPTVSTISLATGPAAGGTAVTITGTGFLAGVTVKLGGTTATGVTLVSSTSITATTPAHAAGAVSVVVTNTDAQSGTLPNGYTYTNPAPTVSTISPATGTAAGGTAVTITGTGFLAGVTVKLGGTAATGVTLVSSTSITATTPAHAAGAVDVVVTNTDAQSATLPSGFTYTSSGGGGTISFVQVKSATTTSASSVAATFAAAQTVGNLNVVAVMWGDTTSTVTSVTDSRGNAYSLAVGPTRATGLTSAIYYAKNIAAGSNTVTVTFNQTAGWPNINVMEYSGLSTTSPLDVTATASGTGTTANSGSATTTAANELIVGAGNPLTTFTAAGAGFSNRIINSFGGISEDKIVSTAGSYNATATMTSGGWIMQMATFKTTP